ncbi:fibronectin type III domain-containing protein [Marinobacter sp. 71-i]|uniref:Fibronectin type III domain-containing protein n=1 Tax=Marinobacter iranensis TaxID=2962607 RepID=A0ABT5YF93_9GAMM|nr:fibronectin type III domain-containing protein [Marinobacter iranensis]MDF0752360.1 fibronectin type III domain-containing protein [Marinobacter iranensis]
MLFLPCLQPLPQRDSRKSRTLVPERHRLTGAVRAKFCPLISIFRYFITIVCRKIDSFLTGMMTPFTSILAAVLYNFTNSAKYWCKVSMNRVIKMSRAWIAAFFVGITLAGCGGGSSGSSGTENAAQGSQSQAAERSASLSWNAPSTRANGDGIKMGELSGYVINYGQNPDALSETVRINDASTMEYTVDNLNNGTWYFTIQVEDIDGLMSAPSAQVSKTI